MNDIVGQISYTIIHKIFIDALHQMVLMNPDSHFNERYLHHYFSREIQKYIPVSFSKNCQLHPEWATAVKGTRRNAKYLWTNEGYTIDERGSSGFVDFAIGDLENPYCGVEVKMSTKIDTKGVIYDLMKLLDNRNKFKEAVSMIVYYGHVNKSKLMRTDTLDNLLYTSKKLLEGGRLADNRNLHIIVAEINKEGSTFYECQGMNDKFSLFDIDKKND